jgi:hypothetical protein
MKDAMSPDPEERLFAESVRDGVHQLREERGPCPSAEELLAFLEGRLESEDAARVGEHVDACGVCDLALVRVRAALADPAGRGMSAWRRMSDLLRNPLLAYGVAALLCYPAYVGIRSHPEPKIEIQPKAGTPPGTALEPPVLSVPSFSLDVVRGAGREAQLPAVRLHDQDKFFLLQFFVPMKADHRYSVEIRDGAGRVTVGHQQITGDTQGKVALMCRRESFAAGEYTVLVNEENPPGPQFAFVFRVE